jgi:chromosome segregation ATPase
LGRLRTEVYELRETHTRNHGDFDKTKAELESTIIKLRAAEDDRDHARQDSQKHHGELRALLREHTDLKGKYSESTTKLESSRKEVLTLSDRIKIWELERDEHLHEKDRLQEEVKRVKLRGDEAYRELSELTDKHERSTREYTKLKEFVRSLESERDDYVLQIGNLRRELKAKSADFEEADARVSEMTLKYEHIKREVVSVKEKLRDVELERTELRDHIDRTLEDHRLLVIERDQLKEDLDDERRKIADHHRQITVLQESLRRAELTITEVRSEVHSVTERNKILIRESEEGRNSHGQVSNELSALRAKLAQAQAEIRTLAEGRDHAYRELNEWKNKYEEMTETVTEFRDDSGELEFEISSLRTLLRDAREQKERAIAARHTADRERDEYIAKYEEKCREMERYEESSASHYHGYSRGGGGKTFTRTVSSGTTVRNGGGDSSAEGSAMFSSH